MIETGISFGEIHSYRDLNLILSAVDIQPAAPKTNYVDITGGDGSLDLTESLGEVRYNDRECSFTFSMNPAGGLSDADFEEKKTEVSNALNGKRFKIILDKDDLYYYSGRCEVSEYLSDRRLRQIVVNATVHPYKFKKNVTVISHELSSVDEVVTIRNSRRSVVPEITCTNDNTKCVLGTVEQMLSAGTHKILDFQLKHGNNLFTVSGTGTITFKYQEADL